MALIEDDKMRPWVEKYAADKDLFFKDFAMAFGKLIGKFSSSAYFPVTSLHPFSLPTPCLSSMRSLGADFASGLSRISLLIRVELGVERDDSGFARLAKKAAKEGKPLDKTSLPGKGCPFAGTTGRGREAKL